MVKALRYKPAGRGFDGVTGIFQWHNPSGSTMALKSTQPLTEMSIRCISRGGKGDNLPPSCAVVMKSGKLNFLEPSGPLKACNGTALPSVTIIHSYKILLCLWYLIYHSCIHVAIVSIKMCPSINYISKWGGEYKVTWKFQKAVGLIYPISMH